MHFKPIWAVADGGRAFAYITAIHDSVWSCRLLSLHKICGDIFARGEQVKTTDSRSAHVALSALAAITSSIAEIAFTYTRRGHAPAILTAGHSICCVGGAGLEDERAIACTTCMCSREAGPTLVFAQGLASACSD